MVDTSPSLLDRVQQTDDLLVWREFTELYTPLIDKWLRQHSLPDQDREDLTQEVMTVLTRRLREFKLGERTGSFRAWLKTITVNCLRNHWRKKTAQVGGGSTWQEQLRELEDPNSIFNQWLDREHDQFILQRAMLQVKSRFEPNTWRAFEALTTEQKSVSEVAEELGLSTNAVCVAKSRVLATIRTVVAGLVDV